MCVVALVDMVRTTIRDAADLLSVEADHVLREASGYGAHNPIDGPGRVQITRPRDPQALKPQCHCRQRKGVTVEFQLASDSSCTREILALPQLGQVNHARCSDRGTRMWCPRAVLETSEALGVEPGLPLRQTRPRHPRLRDDMSDRTNAAALD